MILGLKGVKKKQVIFRTLIVGALFIAVFRWTCVNNPDVSTTIIEYRNSGSEENRLIDLHNFRYLITNDVCNGNETIFMLIFIHSAPGHTEYRNTIRKTWGRELFGVRTVFMLAKPHNQSIHLSLQEENGIYHDMIQGNFIDSYRNLTYKHVMGLRWVADNCSRAKYVMKMDDDIFVDIYQLVNLLENEFSKLSKHIICYDQHHMPVVRDPVSKWYVSKEEYPLDNFEDYCSGWAYITNPKTALELSKHASTLPYLWIDDVHITGQVAKQSGVKRLSLNHYFALETQGLIDWLKSNSRTLWNKVFAPTWGDLKLMEAAHGKAKWCHETNCVCCYSPTTPKPQPTALPATGKSHVRLLNIKPKT